MRTSFGVWSPLSLTSLSSPQLPVVARHSPALPTLWRMVWYFARLLDKRERSQTKCFQSKWTVGLQFGNWMLAEVQPRSISGFVSLLFSRNKWIQIISTDGSDDSHTFTKSSFLRVHKMGFTRTVLMPLARSFLKYSVLRKHKLYKWYGNQIWVDVKTK